MALNIGEKVEGFACHGIPAGRALTETERTEIVEFARGFEECGSTKGELEAMTDKNLIDTAYWAMADYARGQM